jgi:hypothetical protein
LLWLDHRFRCIFGQSEIATSFELLANSFSVVCKLV